jgi:hypothetical protein
MPGENEDLNTTQENTAEVVDESGFDDGFNGTQTETPEVVPETPEEKPEPVQYAQITEQQWQEMQAQASQKFDKAFGQLGGMKQVIERLQEQTRSGHPVEVTEDDVSDLRDEFPEIADLTLKALQKVAGKLKGTGDSPDIERIVTERVSKVQADLIDSRLDEVVDGDWKAEVATPQFQEWLGKQADDVKALSESSSVRDAARMLRIYASAKNQPAAKEPAPEPISARQRQLAAAVNPKSAGAKPSVTSEEDEFDAGFNSGRR